MWTWSMRWPAFGKILKLLGMGKCSKTEFFLLTKAVFVDFFEDKKSDEILCNKCTLQG